jgi:oleate hydratase
MFATIFAFRPGHRAMEMRRYLHRFFHLLPTMASMRAVQRTRFNQYESIVKPVTAWLSGLGVNMQTGSRVSDIVFAPSQGEITATGLVLERGGASEEVKIGGGDLVFFTNGSLVDGSARGSMNTPPEPITAERDGGFALWQSIARTRNGFGSPETFTADVTTSGWISFTITVRDLALMQKLEVLSGRKAGRGGLMTLTASNWLVTLAPLHHPHFIGQPEDVSVIWGYGLFPEKAGSFVNKPMTRCTGAELLEEILRHLGLDDDLHRVLGNSTCIPCFMPYAGSIFMPRQHGDRPAPVPRGSTNFAFIGQYCELPDDVVFTVEYSVRSGRTAAAALLGFKPPPPVYKGEHDPATVVATLKALSS